MDVSDVRRLKALEDENAKLKKLLAEAMLDASALRELLSDLPPIEWTPG
jgi:putative transposase